MLLVKGDFSPDNVDSVQQLKEVPKNFMLMYMHTHPPPPLFFRNTLRMACPTDRFPFNVAQFGGVRIITKHLAPPSPYSPRVVPSGAGGSLLADHASKL